MSNISPQQLEGLVQTLRKAIDRNAAATLAAALFASRDAESLRGQTPHQAEQTLAYDLAFAEAILSEKPKQKLQRKKAIDAIFEGQPA